jgi:hypothetical protein
MKNYKNYLIAVLTGLLVLSLFTQPAQSAPAKTYDAVRLANYTACLYFRNPDDRMYFIKADGTRVKEFNAQLAYCAEWKP